MAYTTADARQGLLDTVATAIEQLGVALAALGEKGRTLVAAIDELAHVMLKITGYVMKLAPIAVFSAMAATVAAMAAKTATGASFMT